MRWYRTDRMVSVYKIGYDNRQGPKRIGRDQKRDTERWYRIG